MSGYAASNDPARTAATAIDPVIDGSNRGPVSDPGLVPVRARGSIGPDWGNPYSKSARVPPAGRRKYDRKLAQFRPDPEPVPASDIARVGLP